MGLPRQEYWRGLPCPLPGDLPNPGIEPASPVSPAFQVDFFIIEPRGKPNHDHTPRENGQQVSARQAMSTSLRQAYCTFSHFSLTLLFIYTYFKFFQGLTTTSRSPNTDCKPYKARSYMAQSYCNITIKDIGF